MYFKTFILIAFLASTFAAQAKSSITLLYTLTDEVNGVDGLDNPRNVLVSKNGATVLVTSADDNSLSVFQLADNGKLSQQQVLKNTAPDINGLEGATSVVQITHNTYAVSGFYDNAIALFKSDTAGNLKQSQLIQGIPEDTTSVPLAGPWDIVAHRPGSELFVANYLNNKIVRFNITPEGELSPDNGAFSGSLSEVKPGNPVGLAFAEPTQTLFVLGYEGHLLTILSRHAAKASSMQQQIDLRNLAGCLNPQKALTNQQGSVVYITCAGSANIVILIRNDSGHYSLMQTFSEQDKNTNCLPGASSLALTNKQQKLYAAGEQGNCLLVFDVNSDGTISLKERFSGEPYSGITSLTLMQNDQHLLVTRGTQDQLLVFRLNNNE